jgi:hypothetical protein
MMTTCVRSGWRAALGNRKLIATLWAWSALAALAGGAAAWRWLAEAFNHSPWADRLLERFQLGLAVELMQYDRFSPMLALNGAVLALVVVGLISNPLVSAGVLEVIVSRDERPLLHRFFRGAGHFFGRFLRLLIISGVAAAVLVVVAAIVTRPISRPLSESSWERTSIAFGFTRFVLYAALIAFVLAVLDIARARVAMADNEIRGMLRAWFGAARFVLRHLGAVAGIYAAFGVMFVVALAAYAAIANAVPTRAWGGILLVVVLQQMFVMARAGLRIARAGATVELCRDVRVTAPVLQP